MADSLLLTSTHSPAHSSETCSARKYSRGSRPSAQPCRGRKPSAGKPGRRRLCHLWPMTLAVDAGRCASGKCWHGCGYFAFQFVGRASAPKSGLPCLLRYLRFYRRCFGESRISYCTQVSCRRSNVQGWQWCPNLVFLRTSRNLFAFFAVRVFGFSRVDVLRKNGYSGAP